MNLKKNSKEKNVLFLPFLHPKLIKKISSFTFQDWLFFISGSAIFFIGLLLFYGWVTDNKFLIFIFPNRSIPMLLNASLAVGLIGLAFISLQFFKPLSLFLSFLIFLLAVITFYEYLSQAHLKVDELFIHSKYELYSLNAGRLPPLASLSLFFISIGIFILSLKKVISHAPLFISCIALMLMTLNLVGILSYFIKSPIILKWGSVSRISLQGGLIFFLIGMIFLTWAFRIKNHIPSVLTVKATSILIIGMLFSILIAELFILEENKKIALAINEEAEYTKLLLQDKFSSLLQALTRLSFEIELNQLSKWRLQKNLHHNDFPYLARMAILDHNLNVQWNEKSHFDEKTLKSLTRQIESNKNKLSQSTYYSIAHPEDNLIYLIFPLKDDAGFFVAEIDMDYFLSEAVQKKTKDNFYLSLDAEDHQWYGVFDKNFAPRTIQYKNAQNFPIADKQWLFQLWPTTAWLEQFRNWPSFFIFFIGILLSLLIALLVHYRQSLKASEEKNKLLLKCAGEGIFGIDLNDEVTFMNPAAVEMLGWTVEDLLGKKMHEKMHHQTKEGKKIPFESCKIQQSIRENRILHEDDEVFWKKSGEPLEITYTSRPIVHDKKIQGAVVTFQDISSRKALERDLLNQKNELLAINKDLEAFSYSVSHDLQAPLRHIMGFTQSIEKDKNIIWDEKGKKLFELIKNAAHRMSQLIDALLFYAHSARVPIKIKKISLNQLIETIIQELKTENGERAIHWEIAQLPYIFADEVLLKSVLTNLISNALKYTQEKEQTEIKIGYTEKKEEYVFFVADNGIGFDERNKERLFVVFQRLHSDEKYAGTGIGLANVKRAIARHGGQVWAEGKVDLGATFYFSLPKKPQSSETESLTPERT